jgi:hypothetical protein
MAKHFLTMPFDRANRTYYVSDERLRAFRALAAGEKLRWVEELASFLRMARPVVCSASTQLPSQSDDVSISAPQA